nr:hypothetical protein [Mycobacterium sp.]
MGFAKPTGAYADEMTSGGGWPNVDEDTFLRRSADLLKLLQQVHNQGESWMHEQTELSSGGIWSRTAKSRKFRKPHLRS